MGNSDKLGAVLVVLAGMGLLVLFTFDSTASFDDIRAKFFLAALILYGSYLLIKYYYIIIHPEKPYKSTTSNYATRPAIHTYVGIVDPALNGFVNKRLLENNLDSDFYNDPDYKIHNLPKKKGEKSIERYLGKSEEPFFCNIEEQYKHNEWWNLAKGKTLKLFSGGHARKYASSNFGVLSADDQVLIYPFFSAIRFDKKLHVIECATYANDHSLPYKAADRLYDLYYFDVKGRFLHKVSNSIRMPLRNHHKWQISEIALEDIYSTEIIPVKVRAEDYNSVVIINPRMYLVYNINGTGILDNEGNEMIPITPGSQILYDHRYSHLIRTTDNKMYLLSLPELMEKELPYRSILTSHSEVPFIWVLTDEGEELPKCALITSDGKEIMPPVYNYVTKQSLDSMYFKTFMGRYEWGGTNASHELFMKAYSDGGVSCAEFYVTDEDYIDQLESGQWGVADEYGEEILQPEYNWTIEYPGGDDGIMYFLVNNGCELFGHSNYFDDNQVIIRGGKWGVVKAGGEVIHDTTLSYTKASQLATKITHHKTGYTYFKMFDLLFVPWLGFFDDMYT